MTRHRSYPVTDQLLELAWSAKDFVTLLRGSEWQDPKDPKLRAAYAALRRAVDAYFQKERRNA